jgi:pyrroline-5-carboxylate reductase
VEAGERADRMSEQKAIRLAVLGTGKLAGALVRGWVTAGTLSPNHLRLYNRTGERAEALARDTGASAVASAVEAIQDADVALVAVKPWAVADTLAAVRDALPEGCLILSVAAGTQIATMAGVLRPGSPIIRVLPNTPALVGAAASAYCRGKHATDAHGVLTRNLFGAVGTIVEVTEEQIDAVVGVSASGVAYFYLIIEALTDGGVRAGLPRDTVRTLAAQTALGAARMILETGEHPAILKDAVTTPGGTTMAALEVLEASGLRGTLIAAVRAARDRSRELG